MAAGPAKILSILLVAAVAVVGILLLTGDIAPSIWIVTAFCIAAAVALIGAAAGVTRERSAGWPNFSSFAQGLAACATIVALVLAAGLYFLERKDKAKLSFRIEANVIRMERADEGPHDVLLAVRVPVENKGSGRVEIRCLAIDVAQFGGGDTLLRSRGAREEMELRPVPQRIGIGHPTSQECLRREARRRETSVASIRPLFMWRPLVLEPGDTDDVHFEMPISCDNELVRVLVKLRIRPTDRYAYESKTLVPLSDTCSGAAETRRGISSPVVETAVADDQAARTEAAPPPAAAE